MQKITCHFNRLNYWRSIFTKNQKKYTMNKSVLFFVLLFIASLFTYGQKVGDKVKVKKSGKYYTATIKQVKNSKYYVDYDGLKSSMNEWVTKDRIKPIKSTTGGKTDANTGNNKVTDNKTNNTSTSPKWKVGDKVMVLSQGSWKSATILKEYNGMYQIHYNGYYSSKYDEWVPPSRIKNQ